MKTGKENIVRKELRTFSKQGKLLASAKFTVDLDTDKIYDGKGKEVKEMRLKCPSTKKE